MVGAARMAAHTSCFAAGRPVFAPALLLAGVNLTAEQPSEPPRGGEQGAGEKNLNRKRTFAESRNAKDNRMRELQTRAIKNAADS